MRSPLRRGPEGSLGSNTLRLITCVVSTLLGAAFLTACRPAVQHTAGDTSTVPVPDEPGNSTSNHVPFVDVAAQVGLDFVHDNGMSGELYYSEMMGGGVALFDYDRDGDLDVYLVDGHRLNRDVADVGPVGRLYRSDLDAGPETLAFTEVTVGSGLDIPGYGMGVVAFDYDNDGWTDLYVTQTGPNRLFRNRGDGSFEELAATAGVAVETWNVPAVVLDVDRDGHLDLFVGDYVDYSLATNKRCTDELGQANYCGPLAYLPLADHLLRNRGDGTFEDISQSSGISALRGRCLGAIAEDFNDDGLVDIYVANDGSVNHLWIQDETGRFTDRALEAGVGVNGQGLPEASMGVAVGDIDEDGDNDVLLGHLAKETNTLFVNLGDGTFRDLSGRSGLGPASLPFTTFGASWLDFDHDGWLDLLTTNGGVKIIKEQAMAGDPHPLRQSNQLFHNRGDGSFEEISRQSGAAWTLSEVSRGSAVGDLDNDGDGDVVIHNNGGPVRLLLNTLDPGAAWIGIEVLDGSQSPPGTRVRMQLSDGRWLHRSVRVGSSYASSEDPRLIFGLGSGTQGRQLAKAQQLTKTQQLIEAQQLIVHWPDGEIESWDTPRQGRYTTLSRGTGRPWQESVPSED